MNLEQIKYSTCSEDEGDAVLLTDVDETMPQTDANGKLQYYCLEGRHTFSADEDED